MAASETWYLKQILFRENNHIVKTNSQQESINTNSHLKVFYKKMVWKVW